MIKLCSLLYLGTSPLYLFVAASLLLDSTMVYNAVTNKVLLGGHRADIEPRAENQKVEFRFGIEDATQGAG